MITTFKGLQNSSVFKEIKKKSWKTILSVGKLWQRKLKVIKVELLHFLFIIVSALYDFTHMHQRLY